MNKIIEQIKDRFLASIDKLKLLISKYFIANESDPKLTRKKHIRVGVTLFSLFIVGCIGILALDNSLSKKKDSHSAQKEKSTSNTSANTSAIKELAKGVSNEQTWTEIRGKEVDEIRIKQSEFDSKQSELETKVNNEKVSKEELDKLIANTKAEIEEIYNQKLLTTVEAIREEFEKKVPEGLLESKTIKQKKKIPHLF